VTAIALLGLGEAGGTIAADLRAAGAEVRGWDPLPQTGPDAPDAPVALGGPQAGDAARRKLLRSIVWKGIAAVGELLSELGVPSRTSDAAAAWLRDLRDGRR
jgi:hypothetical protein